MVRRREFIKTVVASSAATAFFSSHLMAETMSSTSSDSGENHVGIPNRLATYVLLDDVVKLAMTSKLIPAHVNGYIYSDYHVEIPGNISRMGWLVRALEQQVADVIEREKNKAKSVWTDLSRDELSTRRSNILEENVITESKVALMIGWFMARGIREILGPAWYAAKESEDDMAVYQDMYVLRQIAGTPEPGSAETVEDLIQHMIPRAITRIHTLKPDDDDPDNWTVRITDWRDQAAELIKKYAKAYSDPVKAKVQKYVYDSNFYNPDDAVIKAARNHRRINLATMKNPSSLYAKALLKGVEGLIDGSKYL